MRCWLLFDLGFRRTTWLLGCLGFVLFRLMCVVVMLDFEFAAVLMGLLFARFWF